MPPLPVATERFTGRRLSFDLDLLKWTAHREFDVAYAADEDAALAALGQQLGVVLGAAHDLSSVLSCAKLACDKSLFTVIRVGADYTVRTGATASPDPLKQPPLIEWIPTLQSYSMEHTPLGHAMTTAAGQPYESPIQGDVNTWSLVVTRNQPFYDPAAASLIIDTINSDNFVVKGKPMNAAILPGQCRCKSIAPVGGYYLTANFVKVAWRFEVRPTFSTDAKGFSDAWDAKRINKGTMGWCADPSVPSGFRMDYFYSGVPSTKVTEPVYLDLKGQPLEPSIKIGPNQKPPVPNPNVLAGKDLDITFEQIDAPAVTGGFIYLLHYRRFKAIPFSGLL